MRHILRQRELQVDHWHYLGEDARPGVTRVIVPFAQLRAGARALVGLGRAPRRAAHPDRSRRGSRATSCRGWRWWRSSSRAPARVAAIRQGQLLRERYDFRGELRAVGAGVRQDLVFLLARCGFDALELAPGEDVQAAQRALQRYAVAYQPGAAQVPLRRQRFFAA